MAGEGTWLVVARLLRPQGRRGEILAETETDQPIFEPGQAFWLQTPKATSAHHPDLHLESAWWPTGRNAGRIVLKLGGIDDISGAETMMGKELWIPVSDLPPLADDTFRVRDLVGCQLYDDGRLSGTVTDVQFPVAADQRTRLTDAPDLLVIQPAEPPSSFADPDNTAGQVLVPFVKAWLITVNLDQKRIDMRLPGGLFDTLDIG